MCCPPIPTSPSSNAPFSGLACIAYITTARSGPCPLSHASSEIPHQRPHSELVYSRFTNIAAFDPSVLLTLTEVRDHPPGDSGYPAGGHGALFEAKFNTKAPVGPAPLSP
ncbi:hypothetical protein D9619_011284 [Psilocybe cf. subviscida]|uniref:Uncharacterized protein n=1 Tax=Psilocybe cf. subviscida TaxID=2480587 RepID=A0A8H5F5M2_9AGAR|nr:hypothetical protein D9619_011284 [Psilocybe cf. subviscida]